MNLKSLVGVVVLLGASSAFAQEQLILVPMMESSGCQTLDGRKLARLRINLDGSVSVDTVEYVIPVGYVFEITDFQYSLIPNVRSDATVTLSVSKRNVPSGNFSLFRGDAAPLRLYELGSNYTEPVQTGWARQGASTRHQNFNTPFRFSSDAQLCVTPWPRWGLSFAMVIGRLVPYVAPAPTTPTLSVLK